MCWVLGRRASPLCQEVLIHVGVNREEKGEHVWQEMWDVSASICGCFGDSFVLGNVSCGFLAGCVWPGHKDSFVPLVAGISLAQPCPTVLPQCGILSSARAAGASLCHRRRGEVV